MTVLELLNRQLRAMRLDVLARHSDGTETRVPMLRPVQMGFGGALYVDGGGGPWRVDVRAPGCAVTLVERGTGRFAFDVQNCEKPHTPKGGG